VCPECHEPLIVIELEGVEVDHCPTCRGTWLDAGELEFLTEIAGGPPGPLHAALLATTAERRGEERCPRCRRKMRLVTVGAAPPVELDRCPAGHGLWLDAGELAAIVRQFAQQPDAVVAHFFGDLYRHRLTERPEEH
jgi:Zn-finger nucleic acid-binding protein